MGLEVDYFFYLFSVNKEPQNRSDTNSKYFNSGDLILPMIMVGVVGID